MIGDSYRKVATAEIMALVEKHKAEVKAGE